MVVTHRQRVLFGKRAANSTGVEWQLPGGWIEPGESPRQAARREVLEETGLQILEPRFIGVTSNVFPDHNHSISLFFEAECADSEPFPIVEHDRCKVWQWEHWSAVSDNLYLPLRLFKQTDYLPFSKDRPKTYAPI
ncbi:MAG: NUDIX domain-containing protein [Gammaproteobacteria bacterium]|nr:NUDIX domain-containing protein [Gammaproteobacteria bacterium]MDH3447225.1 NUDIX domain-containing protein [Gammaproteobacteria bacterium]